MITYQDYLRYFRATQGNASEGGQAAPFDEATWNRMSPADRWAVSGGGFGLTPDDPRYADLAAQLGGQGGRNIWVTGPDGRDMSSFLVDPSRQVRGDGWSAHSEDNQTPEFQTQDDQPWNYGAILGAAALPIAAGALTGALGAGAGAGTGAMDAMSAAEWWGGVGAGTNPSAGLFGSAVPGAGSGLSGLGADALTGAFDVEGVTPSLYGPPGAVPEPWSAPIGAPNGGTAAAGPGAGTSAAANGATSGLGRFLGDNAGGLIRGAFGLAALGAGSGNGSGNGSGSGAGTDMGELIDKMAAANRVNQNTPIGSRAWTKNPDGTWTVNDTMSAPEKANFENVQGMNAGVTDMARQRLSALLAQPKRGAADAPLNVKFGV